MADIWIDIKKEKDLEWEQLVLKMKKTKLEKEKIAQTTPCDNCGESPAYEMNYNGMYKPSIFPNGFTKNLCKECNERFDEWYYPEDMKPSYRKKDIEKKKKSWW